MTQSHNYILPLKAPSPLPASGVDIVTFKVWRNTLISHVQQDANHHHFMDGGRYAVWQAAELGTRIRELAEDDPDKLVLDGKLQRLGQAAYNVELRQLLGQRNAQLAKFITHIATLCYHTENDDVTNQSTSMTWIFEYLKKHYGLETKGANFMNISEHPYKKGTPYQTYYKQYRASFIDNLRKRGDIVQYKNNQVLDQDEKLSPSFENAIVLWSLEKIDPRLPLKVKKNYGHQMTGNVTLKDVQPVVFDNIDNMLEELDQVQNAKVFAAQLNDETSINAINFRKDKYLNRGSTRQRGGFRGKPPGPQSRDSNKGTRYSISGKFCHICNLAGSSQNVYTSHEIGNCSRLSIRDLESIKNSMVLNGLITIAESDSDDANSCQLQPGWDDKEIEDLQAENSE